MKFCKDCQHYDNGLCACPAFDRHRDPVYGHEPTCDLMRHREDACGQGARFFGPRGDKTTADKSESMVERVARASFNCWRDNGSRAGSWAARTPEFEDMSDDERVFAIDHARAVIAAMREPTAAMMTAAGWGDGEQECPSTLGQALLRVWHAMIDEALKEKPE